MTFHQKLLSLKFRFRRRLQTDQRESGRIKKARGRNQNWCDRNHMTLIVSKCKLLSLKSEQKASLKIQEPGEVDSQWDLGLIVSKYPDWNSNCYHRLSKANSL